jgi:hypothetical protein
MTQDLYRGSKFVYEMPKRSLQQSKIVFFMLLKSQKHFKTVLRYGKNVYSEFRNLFLPIWENLDRVSKIGHEMMKNPQKGFKIGFWDAAKDFYLGPKLVHAMMEKFQKSFKTEFQCGKKVFTEFQNWFTTLRENMDTVLNRVCRWSTDCYRCCKLALWIPWWGSKLGFDNTRKSWQVSKLVFDLLRKSQESFKTGFWYGKKSFLGSKFDF